MTQQQRPFGGPSDADLDTINECNVLNRTLFTNQDNLDVMRGIDSNCIDLIYLDPPFNSNRNYAAPIGDSKTDQVMASFRDTWTMDAAKLEEIGIIAEQNPLLARTIFTAGEAGGKATQGYLTMMALRLLEMRRILKPTGSLYLHCDDRESHYLRTIMEPIFGRSNYRNEIVWKRTAGRSDAHRFGRVHDVILFYTASDNYTWNTPYLGHSGEYVKNAYRHTDERGRYRVDNMTAPGLTKGGESGQPWRGIDPGESGNHWRTPTRGGMNDFIINNDLIPGWPRAYPNVHARLDALDAAGLIHWPKKPGGMPGLKRYLESTKGTAAEDVITDIKRLEANSRENTHYPTQKPLGLLERIIAASSNPGDLVLDPFCGCATACVAAEKLERKWIGIDLSPMAVRLIRERFWPVGLGAAEVEPRFAQLKRGDLIHRTDLPIRTVDLVPMTIDDRHTLYGKQEGNCKGCDWHFPFHALTLDHIIPRAKGGQDTMQNYCLLCGACNSRKGNRLTIPELRAANRLDGRMSPGPYPPNHGG